MSRTATEIRMRRQEAEAAYKSVASGFEYFSSALLRHQVSNIVLQDGGRSGKRLAWAKREVKRMISTISVKESEDG